MSRCKFLSVSTAWLLLIALPSLWPQTSKPRSSKVGKTPAKKAIAKPIAPETGYWSWEPEGPVGPGLSFTIKQESLKGVMFIHKKSESCPPLAKAGREKYLRVVSYCAWKKLDGNQFLADFESEEGDLVRFRGTFQTPKTAAGEVQLLRVGAAGQGQSMDSPVCTLAKWEAHLEANDPDILGRGECEVDLEIGKALIGSGPNACWLFHRDFPSEARELGYRLLLPVGAAPTVKLTAPAELGETVSESCTNMAIIYGQPVPRETVTRIKRANGEPFPPGEYTFTVYEKGQATTQKRFTISK